MTAFSDQPWSRSEDDGSDDSAEAPTPRRTPLSPGAPAEPLVYQTQQRVPGEPGMFRPRRPHPEPAEEDATPPTQAMPAQERPHYRHRDFSPEGRRPVPSWAPAYASGDGGYPSSERLDYQTLGHQEVRAAVERSRTSAAASDEPDSGERAAGAQTEAAADAAGVGAASASLPAVTGAIPVSTPEQPLTRRQLRALREQQEREDQERTETGTEQLPAPSWAPVFSGEPADGGAESAAPALVSPPAEDEQQAAADGPVFVDSAAPATFAVPVQSAPAEADVDAAADGDAEAHRLGEAAGDADPRSTGDTPAESLDDWMAKVFDAPEAGAPTERSTSSDPVALVEPPEPEHWEPSADARPGSPSVYEALFAPPSQAEPAVAEQAAAERAGEQSPAAVDPSDPLAFLGAQPSASERVDLPAPGAWVPPQEPALAVPADAADPTAEEIVVEEEAPSASVDEVAEVHPVVLDAQPLAAEPIQPPAAPEASSGHWTQQAAADDDPYSLSRDVAGGHGVVTTNALMLPSIPQQELSGPLANTGEILITGSIDLPRSLSSTGAHPTQLDESRLDHELDPGDQQIVSADSQPIRAIKAVSTHTSTRGMMLNTKPKGNRSLTVLIIVTGALALAVGAVLVVGLLSNAF